MDAKKYKFADALKSAFMAQRVNSGYHTHDRYNAGMIEKICNKHIVMYCLGVKHLSEIVDWYGKSKHFDYAKLAITLEDEKNCEEAMKWLKGLTFKLFTKNINDFEQAIYDISGKDEITIYDFGRVACIPQTYFQAQKQKSLKQIINENCKNSNWLGNTNAKVELSATMVAAAHIIKYDGFVYSCITENNEFISFWSKHDWRQHINTDVGIRARIKELTHNTRYTSEPIKETKLNRVKLQQMESKNEN